MTLPVPTTRVIEDVDSEVAPPYHLILLDDNEHTYQYVIAMLGSIFGYAPEKGFAIACVVDKDGQAILMTAGLEEVKLKQDQIHAYGADPAMPESKGSMSAVIEPADTTA
ncbi:MAG: ATP-dependent Clp protease adaptor ClpS [Dehalococcoidia bacterium]